MNLSLLFTATIVLAGVLSTSAGAAFNLDRTEEELSAPTRQEYSPNSIYEIYFKLNPNAGPICSKEFLEVNVNGKRAYFWWEKCVFSDGRVEQTPLDTEYLE